MLLREPDNKRKIILLSRDLSASNDP